MKPEVDWRNALLQVKDKLPVPIASSDSNGNQRLRKSKKLRYSLGEAAIRFNISKDRLILYLNKLHIHPTQKLKAREFLLLARRFDKAYYEENKQQFDQIIHPLGRKKKRLLKQPALSKVRKAAAGDEKAFTRQIPFSKATPISQWVEISWENVFFEDYAIKVKYSEHYSGPYHVSDSRKSFIHLRKYIAGANLQPLKVLLTGNTIQKIENADQLKTVFTFLRVQSEFIEREKNDKSVTVEEILKLIEPLSSAALINVAKAIAEESNCLEYLGTLQDVERKPVPAFEVIPSANSIVTEATFIFTLRNKGRLFLVWESTRKGKATFLFTTDLEHWTESIQAIYDYIASRQRAKRMKLRMHNPDMDKLKYQTIVTHTSFRHWQEKLGYIITHTP